LNHVIDIYIIGVYIINTFNDCRISTYIYIFSRLLCSHFHAHTLIPLLSYIRKWQIRKSLTCSVFWLFFSFFLTQILAIKMVIFWSWAQLMKPSLSSLVLLHFDNYENFLEFNTLLPFELWAFTHGLLLFLYYNDTINWCPPWCSTIHVLAAKISNFSNTLCFENEKIIII